MAQFRSYIRRPRAAQPAALTPRRVANAYHFPLNKASGKGYVGGIIELGGGYNQKQVETYFTRNGLPVPRFVTKLVGAGQNMQDGPDGADGEVQLDMLIAGSVAPGAIWNVYFADNTDTGFNAAVAQAIKDGCNGITISWGSAEDAWGSRSIAAFEKTFAAARAAGVAVFAAAGDSGSRDSESHNVTDYPASSPNVIGCGGTRLEIDSQGARSSETVWNDSPTQSATGGGVSKVFAGRQVPDIAGNADPDSGYVIDIDGQQGVVIGGTSAVAPLCVGLHALLWELNGGKPFDFLNLVVTNPQAFFDVTVGDNGGYRAGPGRDETTGFGVPDGQKLADALLGPIPAPAPPNPTPAPTPAPPPVPKPPPVVVGGGGSGNGGSGPGNGSDPLLDFPTATVDAWLAHKHTHTHVEAAAATAIIDWAQSHGISLKVVP